MTIAQQLNVQTFPFIIKDADGKDIYWENSRGSWSKWEYAGGEMIYWVTSDGIIRDNRPKTDVQKAIDLLTTEGLIVDGKILKN